VPLAVEWTFSRAAFALGDDYFRRDEWADGSRIVRNSSGFCFLMLQKAVV